MSEILTVGGVVYVGRPDTKRRSALHVGRHVGWFPAPGIRTWTKDVSVVQKSALTPAILKELGVELPEAVAAKHKSTDAATAAAACGLVAVTAELSSKLVAKGLRVYSVGCDRITGGIYFFAEGGNEGPMRLQGDLISMVAPNLPDGATNNEIEDAVESVIDRLLSQLSGGLLNELEVELAEALPKLGEEDPRETLQTFEGYVLLGRSRSEKYATEAGNIAKALETALRSGSATAKIDLFQEAFSETQPALALSMNAAGEDRVIKLPARTRWITTHELTSVRPPPVAAATPSPAEVAAKKKADEEAAAAKAKAEQEAAAKKKAEQEAAAKAKAEQEAAAAKAKAEQEAAAAKAKAEQEAAAAKAKAEQEAAAKKAEEEAAAKKKAEEEAAAAAKKKAEEEAAAAAKKKADEESAAKKKVEEEAAAAKKEAEKALAKDGEKTAVKVEPARTRQDSVDNITLPTSKSSLPYIIVGIVLALVILFFVTRG